MQTGYFIFPMGHLNSLCNYLHLSSGAPASGPAFICRSNSKWKVISAEVFIGRVRECLTSCNPSEIGCHSFRHGSTSLCHAAGFNDTSIKFMGDWASNCFTSYIDNSVKTCLKLTSQLRNLSKRFTTHTIPLQFGCLVDILYIIKFTAQKFVHDSVLFTYKMYMTVALSICIC